MKNWELFVGILSTLVVPAVCCSVSALGGWFLRGCDREPERRIPASWEAATLDQCAQSEQVCHAVAERLGITVTLPPWQAMVLAPILDPR